MWLKIFVRSTCLMLAAVAVAGAEWDGRGPVIFTTVLPARRDSAWEPLLSLGAPGAGEVVFFRRLADGRAAFGWERAGGTAFVSEPQEAPPGGAHEVLISLGSQWPAAGAALYAEQPALAALRGVALVQFRGRTVLVAKGNFVPTPERAQLGRNEVGGALARPFFLGKISAAHAAAPAGVLAAFTAPGQLLAAEPGAPRETAEFPGPIRLRVLFPGGGAGHNEPLLTTGVTGAGDFVYVRYVDENHVRLGYDHWLVGGPLSEPLPCEPGVTHEITVSIGALMPAPAAGEPAEFSALRKICVVLLDGHPVVRVAQTCHPTRPEQITLGANTIGGSTANVLFTGEIRRVERVAPADVLKFAP